jgi:hypothetical protein
MMRALQISRSKEISIPVTTPGPQIQVTTGNDLQMKVANTGGRVRTISLDAVRGAMSRAWGRSYGAISQVEPNLFMAHFEDFDAMWFVFSEQPWYVGRENLLIELVRPDARSNPLESYRFESLYVTAKIYGIPYSLRTEDLAKRIVGTFGEPSNLQPLTEAMLLDQREYARVKAKVNIRARMVDRVKLRLPSTGATFTAYIHYGKIQKICTFCGVMFHEVAECALRR